MKIRETQTFKNYTPTVISVFFGVAFVELLAISINQPYLPRATGVSNRLITLLLEGQIFLDLLRSLQNLFLGFTISVISGLVIGMLCGRYKYFEQMLRPYINAMLTTPSVIFAPVYFAIFGLARWSIVGLIVHYSVFYIIVNTTTAVQSVDRGMIEMSMVFGANERQQMRLIYLPSSLPLIFASLRVALARSVKGMINGELLIAVIGLGAFSSKFASVYDAEGVFAVALLVVLVAIVLSGCLNMVNKRVNSWVPNIRKDK